MKKILINIYESIIPNGIDSRLSKYFRNRHIKERKKREAQLTGVRLSKKHMQNCELLLNRIELLKKLGKKGVIAELGVDKGEFSENILQISEPSSLHLIDLWGSERYDDSKFKSVRSKFSKYFDWIYIDTDHSYETTKEELFKYAPKVKDHGIIAGHDYSLGNWIKEYRY